ncbi:uncharacterized protein GLRG_08480 [Colletotrichum graminicola M1.001]|uniref:Uncharacterized protein n=1 Tax=Colletotrichum graminicola (strain M1.001 / M2 / FGSC 10212) TaxID=645133 RepID=E3QR48_COLGM|nr:uncharacterized protein GLRG_08480 [Colletotrichum graminicola M1.001]EFQ33336.1 hypothetical protein GLRG_08480 [Colletotrichum graminicola M1.001]
MEGNERLNLLPNPIPVVNDSIASGTLITVFGSYSPVVLVETTILNPRGGGALSSVRWLAQAAFQNGIFDNVAREAPGVDTRVIVNSGASQIPAGMGRGDAVGAVLRVHTLGWRNMYYWLPSR